MESEMPGRVPMFITLVVVIAGAWAALVTFFVPPLTLGWREFVEAMVRRWVRNAVVLGVAVLLILVLLALFGIRLNS
jgi:NADH:ubiquinone oxidoreductase subunit 6 (subunit J)